MSPSKISYKAHNTVSRYYLKFESNVDISFGYSSNDGIYYVTNPHLCKKDH